ncbi:SusC/RagA family TonB-linked outer membrane protein [Pedobacter sp. HMF7647]|uniref:SusC/RagA family TonB-linked outer membrane protein n=1 Tax=Hufsiella arboris TaxID=2695275 RepID=A0A7K1Y8R4_9SPHI|nr:TonB-dependent receptor [Hufsiella arboris]MXV50984.1 SusC/RagA family TonB-linked outer membrane protein [Hufsiella arboris]
MNLFYLIRNGFLTLLICSFAVMANAQTGSISGTVIDETNQPLPGASVAIKGAAKGTSTGPNGQFRLSGVPQGQQVLVVSFIGYQQKEVAVDVNGAVTTSVKLAPNAQNLNEVVVIGYGTQQKKDLTGSVATVNSKDFQKGTITTPEQLIAGKVAGVNVLSNSGQPGVGSTIRIRGGASLNASNDPLIVIDGVPFSGNTIDNAPNPLSLINPNDIETFTVLKDANATAIYGSRASNGVVLITTKKGKAGAPVINFSTNNGIATVAKKVDVLSADQIREFVNANGNATQKALLGTANTDWQDEIYQNAFSTDNNLSVAGSFKGVPYRVSGGYLDQQGLLITDKFNRATAAINLSPKLFTDHLKIDLNVKGSLTGNHYANSGAIGSAIQFDPTQPVYANNAFGGYYEWIQGSVPNPNAPRNPVALIRQQDNNGNAERSFGNLKLDYSLHFLPELHANLNVGYDVSKGYGSIRVPIYAAQSAATSGSITNSKNLNHDKFAEFYLNYVKTVESIKSKFDVTAGYGYYDNARTLFYFPTYKGTGEVLTTPSFPDDVYRNKLLSYYGRLIYTFNDKYILSGTMRADGSSKFAENNRWGYFPSAAFTWRVIGEDFLKNSKAISDLKLRLSYGQTGNKDGIKDYDYLSKYYSSSNTGQYQVGNTFYNYYSPAAYDPDLKWETTTTYNAGIDYEFMRGRIFGAVDVYYKKTEDLLSTVNIPVGTNFSNLLTTNVGNMDVRGIEASINFNAINTENLHWNIGINGTYNKRKVTNLTLYPDPGGKVSAGDITGATGTTLKYNSVNEIPGSFYVYKQVYDASGKPLENVYADLNGDGVINTSDQYFYKSPDPKFFFGFNTSLDYKKWTLSAVLRSNIDNYVYDNVSSNFGIRSNVLSPSGLINNADADIYNTNFQSNEFLSDYYVKNASFLKMDNLGLAYNFGKLSPNSPATLRISANCQNVFTITNYKGLDPELSSGIDYNLYPRPRTYTLGVNVGF